MPRVWNVLAVCAVMLAVLIAMPSVMLGQSDTTSLSGTVRDSSGAVVPGANVSVRNEATSLERRTTTNTSGYYVATNLPPGTYTVTVEATGFKKSITTGKKVDAAVAAALDISIDVGNIAETVEVVASATSLQSETATVGRTVEQQQIENLMLNGRNAIRLASLKAGVVSGSSIASFGFGLTDGGYSINGSRSQDNVITVDGAIATRTRANGTAIGAADVETLQEVQVLTANYNAEYGRAGGGQIRMVTKSGTNELHGSVYDYFRNDALDANSWQRNRAGQDREKLRFNQFGYSASGPVFIPKFIDGRNKFFWLWSQEWVRFNQDVTSNTTVPTLDMRQGNFSQLLSTNPFYSVRQLVDPLGGNAPFTNNIIPAARRSSNGAALLNAYPEPTPGYLQGRNNFFQTRGQPTRQRKDTLALDYMLTENQALRYRRQYYNWWQTDAFRANTDRAVTDWERPNISHSISHTWTVNPTTINETMLTASADKVYIGIDRRGNRFGRTQYGINYPYIFPDRKEIFDKIPTVAIPGMTDLDGGPYPAFSSGPIYQLQNTTTKISGNHTYKFGVRFDRQGQNDFDQINVTGVPGGTNNQNGRFAFTDTRSGLGVANAYLGLADTYAEIGPRAYTPYRSESIEWFVQDSWRVSSRLTMEMGVRHTLMQPYYYSLWRNMAVFDVNSYDPNSPINIDPATGNILSGNRYNGVRIPGTGWTDAARGRVAIADSGEFNHLFTGGSKTWGEMQKLNFQPRFGLAYKLTNRSVLRAGGGKFFARPGVADNIFLGGNPPFQPMASIANPTVDNPGGGAAVGFPQFFMTSDPVFKTPSTWTWNTSLQQEIGAGTVIDISYVGRQGQNLERTRELNALQPGTIQANPGRNVNFLRPYRGFAFINLGENAARSIYHGLQISADRRFNNGLGYGVAYTYSKSSDDGSDRRAQIINPFDARQSWGPSNFDRRQVLVFNYVYDLPFFKGSNSVAGKLLGGWNLSGVTQLQTGTPGSVTLGVDYAGIGSGNQAQPWLVNGSPSLSRGERAYAGPDGATTSTAYWFATKNGDGSNIFAAPAQGTFAPQGWRGSFYQPGFQSWNISTSKRFQTFENQGFEFRAEFFNFPNYANLNGADTNPNSGTFGKITKKKQSQN